MEAQILLWTSGVAILKLFSLFLFMALISIFRSLGQFQAMIFEE
jgi:hypothetical protein